MIIYIDEGNDDSISVVNQCRSVKQKENHDYILLTYVDTFLAKMGIIIKI